MLVVRNYRRPMPGAVFLSCVATEGLAVLAATPAKTQAVAWPAYAALVLFWLGLVLYVFALCCFDLRQLLQGHGDHWIAVGALAISALAGARLIAVGGGGTYLWDADDSGVLRTVTLALFVLDLCWYAVLVVAELVRPRLRYDVRRWSDRVPDGHDGGGERVRRGRRGRPVAGAREGAAVGRGGGVAGRRRGRGPGRARGAQGAAPTVTSTARR
ncbi:hypothetical protein ACFY3J_31315 [Streptomyces sp. NPDC001231]|uniref:SLAC1 family transporter n=1 Tax=Streptomyces sp. NPDC001231 TaxID=3364549 RepID=UPI0036CF67A8